MSKELDTLLWWIPFKKVREKIRNIYYDMDNKINNLNNNINYLNDRINNLENYKNWLLEDKEFKDRFIRYLIYNSDMEYKTKKWVIERTSNWLGYFINIDNPKTFNEKIHWMKLYYRNPLMKRIVDKYQFKDYIKEQLGDGYTVPLLGVWDNVNDIDFYSLPNQFVLKSNVGGNSEEMIIVKDKNILNIEEAKMKMNEWLQPWNNVAYKVTYHWDSVDIPQKIIAEEYIEEIDENAADWKFLCSFGKILYISNSKKDKILNTYKSIYLDENGNDYGFMLGDFIKRENFQITLNFEKMKKISKKLSKDFPIVRIDFYDLKDKLLLGEFTFYSNGGHAKFTPEEFDYKFGEMVDLTKIPKEHLAKEWLEIKNKM